jgi:DNA-directed RNA polymerase specialized sigma subunit
MEMNLIYERALSFHHTTGIELEDLVSQATEAYLKAEKTFQSNKNTKITTYVYTVITNELLYYCRSKNRIRTVALEEEDLIADTTPFESKLSFDMRGSDVIKTFSKNVQTLIKTIFEHADDFELSQPRKCRMKLLTILEFELGWGQKRRKQTIAELKQILKTTAENDLF